jgi:hypothetical protein
MTMEGGSQNENSGSAQRPGKAGGDATQQQMTLKTPNFECKGQRSRRDANIIIYVYTVNEQPLRYDSPTA